MAEMPIQQMRPRILVIDDDEGVRATLEIMLQESGFDVLMARDGNQGLGLFLAQPVDLVITDMLMPLKKGYEMISEIRRMNRLVPIIAMSGGSMAAKGNVLTAARKNGADRIIEKPFDYDDLKVLVRDLLPGRFGASDGVSAGELNTAGGG